MATKKAEPAVDNVQRLIYLGPNHPRSLIVNSTIYKGGVPPETAQLLERCPSAKALLVTTDQTAAVMQGLRDNNSVYAALYKQADKELHKGG